MMNIKDSGVSYIGNIPISWYTRKIKYVAVECSENGLMNPEESQYIGLENVAGYSNEIIITDTKYETSIQKKCYKDNILFGKLRPYLSKVVIVPYDGFCTGEFLELAKYKGDNRFLRYSLLNTNLIDTVNMSTYGAKMPRASSEFIMNCYIAYPTYNEQKIIADFLDAKCTEIDALSMDIQAEIDTLEEYKRSMIIEKVTKGLKPDVTMKDSGVEWLGGIPDLWRLSRIGSVYELRNTKVSDKDYLPLSVTNKGVVPQLETAAKTNAHDDRKLVRKGDFVINSRSDRRGSCGISSYDGSVSLINIVLAPLGEMNPRYYDWLFHTIQFGDEFYKWGHGIVDDLWTTNWQDMKKIIIPMPNSDEQEKIATFLDTKCSEIDSIIETKKEQLMVLDEYKKAIIYEYVTGKKEVKLKDE